MGQRLVVELEENNNLIASIYYHWSAYFSPTIQELKFLSDDILEAEQKNEDVLLAILKGLEKRGGGLRGMPEDLVEAKKLFPTYEFKDPEQVSRNDGIITFIPGGMESFYNWADGMARIYLDTHKIINMCLEEPEPFEIQTQGGVPQCVIYKNIMCPVNPTEMTCESVRTLYEFMDKRFMEG